MPFVGSATPPTSMNYGKKGSTLSLSGETAVPANAKAIICLTAGNLQIRPAGESSGSITFTAVPAGFIPPYVVGVVIQAGTTAGVATVEDE